MPVERGHLSTVMKENNGVVNCNASKNEDTCLVSTTTPILLSYNTDTRMLMKIGSFLSKRMEQTLEKRRRDTVLK